MMTPFQIVDKFLQTEEVKEPFFWVVGDTDYTRYLNTLKKMDFCVIRISDFCAEADRVPDFDGFVNHLKSVCNKSNPVKILVIGLGEYLALQGKKFALKKLKYLQPRSFEGGKIVFLLRGVAEQVLQMCKDDQRFDSRRRYIPEQALSDVVVERLAPDFITFREQKAVNGLKELLRILEDGCQQISVKTRFKFEGSLYAMRYIDNVYKIIADVIPHFDIPQECGSRKYWRQLAEELQKNDTDFELVLRRYGIDKGIGANLKREYFNENYESWICFIALKYYSDALQVSNPYLKLVVDKTILFSDFKKNILCGIIDIPHSNADYRQLYERRRTILKIFSDADLEAFISENRRDLKESVYHLTDTTFAEKREVIEWVGRYGIIPELEYIYPALFDYLQCYTFNTPTLSDELTDYFEAYKLQKVKNVIEPAFMERVEEIARERIFNRLPTRNEMVDFWRLKGQKAAGKIKLFWVDALGVEYMSAISAMCRNNDLSIATKIARADLPTITSINHSFYDDWEDSKDKIAKLDDTKHNNNNARIICQRDASPSYLALELDCINELILTIAEQLKRGDISQAIVVSDHGASRLAVISGIEEKYATPEDSRGEHSGRCCKVTESDDQTTLEFATEENGWLVLANYGRFKGSRQADVEVHGGATLEEVVVPVIRITLRNRDAEIELTTPVVTASHREPAQIELYSHIDLTNVRAELIRQDQRNVSYIATPVDDARHFKVRLDEVKRAGTYKIKVYSNDDFLGDFSFVAQGGSARINSSFDDDLEF